MLNLKNMTFPANLFRNWFTNRNLNKHVVNHQLDPGWAILSKIQGGGGMILPLEIILDTVMHVGIPTFRRFFKYVNFRSVAKIKRNYLKLFKILNI